jgi:hypothetical protein
MLERGDAPGVIVNVTIEDTSTTLLKLSRFIVDKFVTGKENSAATYVVTNPGDTPLVPSGEVIFYDSKGREVGALPVNPDNETVNPGEERVFNASVPIEGLFGKYKAFLTVEYGSGNVASVNDTAFYYVLPIRTLLVSVLVLSIIVIIASFYVHRRYFDDAIDDGSEFVPLRVRDSQSDPLHHDIDLRSS